MSRQLLIIYPNSPSPLDTLYRGEGGKVEQALYQALRTLFIRRSMFLPPVAAAQLAAITPPNWRVTFIDEQFQQASGDEQADLVAMTVTTRVAPRAYELATAYRSRGVPVVMGGFHPTLCPDEVSPYATSICLGDADGVWSTILEDCEKGRLAPRYDGAACARDNFCAPDSRVYDRSRYITTALVQTQRGCKFRCSFCSVPAFFGRSRRRMKVESLQKYLAQHCGQFVMFTDDNLNNDREWLEQVCDLARKSRIDWCGAATLDVARDETMVQTMAASGCKILLIGFESLSQGVLRKYHKANRVQEYSRLVATLHAHGIAIVGCFIFGDASDDGSEFEACREFCEKERIELPVLNLLTPYPGSQLAADLAGAFQGGEAAWPFYDGFSKYLLSHPRLPSEFWERGIRDLAATLYRPRSILRRIRKVDRYSLGLAALNLAYRRSAQRLGAV